MSFSKATARLGLVAFACLLLSSVGRAQGCGPTRLKVSESVTLDLTPAQVWAMVGDFQAMAWDPDVVAIAGSGGNDVDHAARTVTLKGGAVLGESLYKFDAGARTYSYHIDAIDVDRLPVQNVSATIAVEPRDGGTRTLLVWRAAFYRFLKPGEPAPDVADAEAAKAVTAYLRSGLDGFKARSDANKLVPKT